MKDSAQERYYEGLNMEQFAHLPQISRYNLNYYVGFDKDLLYAKSDDDDTTTWYLIKGCDSSILLGESYMSEGDKLHKI